MALWSLLVPALLLAQEPTVYEFRAKFSEKEFKPYQQKGSASIAGRAFIVTQGGEAIYPVGRSVYLIPATGYTTEWFEKFVIDSENICFFTEDHKPYCKPGYVIPPDERAQPYIRSARVDADGQFWFRKLPAGKYFVTCLVQRRLVDRSSAEIVYEGVIVHEFVEVERGDSVRVVVTRNY